MTIAATNIGEEVGPPWEEPAPQEWELPGIPEIPEETPAEEPATEPAPVGHWPNGMPIVPGIDVIA